MYTADNNRLQERNDHIINLKYSRLLTERVIWKMGYDIRHERDRVFKDRKAHSFKVTN